MMDDQDSRYRFSFSPAQFWCSIGATVLLVFCAFAAGVVSALVWRR